MATQYSPAGVTFRMVYIMEAHASDGWPMPSSRFQPQGQVVDIPNHTSVEDRMKAAKSLVEDMNVQGEVFIDSMENTFNSEYGAWPTMFYIIKDGRLVFIGDHEGDKFRSDGLFTWLNRNYPSANKLDDYTTTYSQVRLRMLHSSSIGSQHVSTKMRHRSSLGCCVLQ